MTWGTIYSGFKDSDGRIGPHKNKKKAIVQQRKQLSVQEVHRIPRQIHPAPPSHSQA